jgi:hypothetical protein
MPTPEEERFARLLERLTPAQRRAYLEKQANATRLQQIIDAIESGEDEPDDPTRTEKCSTRSLSP